MVFPLATRPHSRQQNPQYNQFLAQNAALAKKNSFLMTKITTLETKISELIQENIDLRALNAKNEDGRRRNLEEKLGLIEEGVAQRFEDMLQMFATIRQNEGLPPPAISVQTLLRNITSHEHSHSEKTVTFDTPPSDQHPKVAERSERRRKSARRQSIYIAPPSPEKNQAEEDDNKLPVIPVKQQPPGLSPEQQSLQSLTVPLLSAPSLSSPLSSPSKSHDEEIPVNFDEENPFMEQPDHDEEVSHHSLNDYLIPEEADENDDSTEMNLATSLSPIKIGKSLSSPQKEQQSPVKTSRILVYEDSPEPSDLSMGSKIKKLVSDSVKVSSSDTPEDTINKDEEEIDEHKPLEQDVSKIKHTKAKKQKTKSTADEEMPESITADEIHQDTRSRRSRGKQVSYAEPSLRVKMRRQSEKFVDAIVEDAFVRPSSSSSTSRRTSVKIENSVDLSGPVKSISPVEELSSSQEKENVPTTKVDEYIEASRDSPTRHIKPLTVQDSVNITKRRKPLASLNKNKIQKTEGSGLKKAAVKDVFDLVDEEAVGVPKTYKGKVDTTTRRRSGGRRHSTAI